MVIINKNIIFTVMSKLQKSKYSKSSSDDFSNVCLFNKIKAVIFPAVVFDRSAGPRTLIQTQEQRAYNYVEVIKRQMTDEHDHFFINHIQRTKFPTKDADFVQTHIEKICDEMLITVQANPTAAHNVDLIRHYYTTEALDTYEVYKFFEEAFIYKAQLPSNKFPEFTTYVQHLFQGRFSGTNYNMINVAPVLKNIPYVPIPQQQKIGLGTGASEKFFLQVHTFYDSKSIHIKNGISSFYDYNYVSRYPLFSKYQNFELKEQILNKFMPTAQHFLKIYSQKFNITNDRLMLKVNVNNVNVNNVNVDDSIFNTIYHLTTNHYTPFFGTTALVVIIISGFYFFK